MDHLTTSWLCCSLFDCMQKLRLVTGLYGRADTLRIDIITSTAYCQATSQFWRRHTDPAADLYSLLAVVLDEYAAPEQPCLFLSLN